MIQHIAYHSILDIDALDCFLTSLILSFYPYLVWLAPVVSSLVFFWCHPQVVVSRTTCYVHTEYTVNDANKCPGIRCESYTSAGRDVRLLVTTRY